MIDRRQFSTALASTALAAFVPRARAFAAQLGEDGLHIQPFFMQTFLDMSEDKAEAETAGKHFAVIFEQRGCPYCREMHEVNFARPEIADYVASNFGIVQLNMWGSREVTDFDGEVLPEKELARKYGVAFTPTVQFFPDDPAAVEGKAGKEAEVARMPGYFEPPYFMAIFRFVREKAYEQSDFLTYARKALQQSQNAPSAADQG